MLHRVGVVKHFRPRPGKVNTGDLKSVAPFSTEFGYDRGGPVDRFYIEQFLQQEKSSIRGRVLEIGDNEYTVRFGRSAVEKSDILHVHAGNPAATIIGDLTHLPQVADNSFDCIVLTQTLHLIYDFRTALQTCHRILKPGGVLLVTAPGITPIDHGEWKETWYWSFTDRSLKKIFGEMFAHQDVQIASYGNVFIATAFLYGMGIGEVEGTQLAYHDPHYPVTLTVKATKH